MFRNGFFFFSVFKMLSFSFVRFAESKRTVLSSITTEEKKKKPTLLLPPQFSTPLCPEQCYLYVCNASRAAVNLRFVADDRV